MAAVIPEHAFGHAGGTGSIEDIKRIGRLEFGTQSAGLAVGASFFQSMIPSIASAQL